MKMQTKLKIENFLNRIQRNFTLMEWFVFFVAFCLIMNWVFA